MSTGAVSAAPGEVLVGRCYTKPRRHPSVIGRWPGGRGRIWGGPYTMPQMAVLVVSLVVLLVTREMWGHFGLANILVVLGVPYGLALLVRHIQVDGRNPLAVAASAAGLLAAPSAGRLGGRPLKAVDGYRPLIGVCTVTWNPSSSGGSSTDAGPVRSTLRRSAAGPSAVRAVPAPAPARKVTAPSPRAGTVRAPVSVASSLLDARRRQAASRAHSSGSTKTGV